MSRQDYTEQHSMPPWCETHDGPRGGRGAENCSVCFDEQPQPLPTRLRALAPQLKEIMGMIPAEEDGAIRMLDYMRALEAENLGYKFEEWAAELEKGKEE